MLAQYRARLIVVPLFTIGCHTWSTVPLSPETSAALPRHSTVVLIGGERVQIEDGRTTRDSVIGARLSGARCAVARESVDFVETRKVSVVRSVGLGAGGVVVAGTVLSALALGVLISVIE
jgi:hypothetical protein